MAARRHSRLACAFAAALAALAGCGGEDAPPAPPPAEVRVFVVQPRPIANVVELPGRTQAVRTAEVRARVNGIVERRLYSEGSDVAAGTPLFRIDPRELSAALAQARAGLARAQATAANAAQVVARYRPLVNEQAVSRQENDAAIAASRQSEADVAQARAQVQAAELALGYTTVRAPIAGRVGRAEVTEGALVSASGATLMTRVEQLNPIYVNFAQSNSDLLALRRDITAGRIRVPEFERVEVRLLLEDGSTFGPVGHLDFLDFSVDETTGSVSLRAEFPNPGRTLLPGQFVRARLSVGVIPNGILVPQRAVRLAANGASVLVVGANDMVAERAVTLGDLQGAMWVIRSGLRPGDRIVTDGGQKARPGQKVRIEGAGAPAASPRPR